MNDETAAWIKKLKTKNKEVRQDAVLALATVGDARCTKPVTDALRDDDDYIRSYAMMGIGRGIGSGKCTREFLDAVFAPLVKLLDRSDQYGNGDAPKLLLAIDPARAMPV